MTTATIRWSEEDGFWVVEDECGTIWQVYHQEDRVSLCQRETSQGWEGAEFVADPGRDCGEMIDVRDGDEKDGWANGETFVFSARAGWEEKESEEVIPERGHGTDYGQVWDALQSPVYRVLDEEGNNVADCQVRHFLGRYWLCVDNTDGYQVMLEEDVERLILQRVEEAMQ